MDLNKFLTNNIFQLMGLEDIDENHKQALFEKFFSVLENRVIDQLVDMLSEDDKKSLDNLDGDNLAQFLDDKFSDETVERIASQEASILKRELLDQSEDIDEIIKKINK